MPIFLPSFPRHDTTAPNRPWPPPPPFTITPGHTHTHYDSSGRVIGPSQRPIPNNTQHSQQTDIHRTPLDEWSARRTDLYLTTHNTQQTHIHRTPLDGWSARRTDLYLTTHNTHNRQISMTPVGFEPMISASERPQTYALDRAATGTGKCNGT